MWNFTKFSRHFLSRAHPPMQHSPLGGGYGTNRTSTHLYKTCIQRGAVITPSIFSKFSQLTPYSLPVRASYGLFFVSTKSDLCSAPGTAVLYEYHFILDRAITALDCIRINGARYLYVHILHITTQGWIVSDVQSHCCKIMIQVSKTDTQSFANTQITTQQNKEKTLSPLSSMLK